MICCDTAVGKWDTLDTEKATSATWLQLAGSAQLSPPKPSPTLLYLYRNCPVFATLGNVDAGKARCDPGLAYRIGTILVTHYSRTFRTQRRPDVQVSLCCRRRLAQRWPDSSLPDYCRSDIRGS
jgi:hypothetical protein